mmetsp:Transcript_65732/g.182194  ORF Transcript_65732/g.182194 Transcript_65732/m.182194 type:complete len:137 (-) Transcript_65732:270-680(-)|eukprot:CAMPEP_0179074792 /NCGR_PEP_ID=MMETSP0796-20121207/33266_1 /TAXON_ID=73915 /ORGANISM="Pyrodinium bahamense, Strain pbaha01" /LENGTH=136 /DNA_ID=CAMNT_0020772021 /DNA_START=140 /DNA_END=550 /DNA_ORIENTATION=+
MSNHAPVLDPATLPMAGLPRAISYNRTPRGPAGSDRGVGSSRPLGNAGGLVAAGQAAAAAHPPSEGDAARGHDDAAIGAGLMASNGTWRPEKPLQSAASTQAAAQVVPAGMPNDRRPCIGRLAHHIIAQPEKPAGP